MDATASPCQKTRSKSRYEQFEMAVLNRADIKNAPYNPRQMDAGARKKLAESIKRTGLVQAPVVNKRTGNLVAGHQRLSIIDSLEGRCDYDITVHLIDVNDVHERELNVMLNNQFAQGNFNLAMLSDVLQTSGLDARAAGFEAADVEILFDGSTIEVPPLPSLLVEPDKKPLGKLVSQEQVNEDAMQMHSLMVGMHAASDRGDEYDQTDFYIVIVCASRRAKQELLAAMKMKHDTIYIDAQRVADILGVTISREIPRY